MKSSLINAVCGQNLYQGPGMESQKASHGMKRVRVHWAKWLAWGHLLVRGPWRLEASFPDTKILNFSAFPGCLTLLRRGSVPSLSHPLYHFTIPTIRKVPAFIIYLMETTPISPKLPASKLGGAVMPFALTMHKGYSLGLRTLNDALAFINWTQSPSLLPCPPQKRRLLKHRPWLEVLMLAVSNQTPDC